MSQNQIRNLQDKLACQEEQICDLKQRLSTYNEDMAAKDALQKQLDELKLWVEEDKINYEHTNNDQLKIIECQSKKLENSNRVVSLLRADNHRLSDVNKFLTEQLKTLQRDEERLTADIEKLETSNKILENELCNAKNQLHRKCCELRKLTEQLKCKQDELQCVRTKLEECQTAVDQLKDKCKKLETDVASTNAKLEECETERCRLQERCRDREADLKCARAKMEDVKSRAAATETRLQTEAATLAKELECRARKLWEAETERDRSKCRAAEEQCRADRSNALVAELRAAGERERAEAEAREKRLKRDVCERDEGLRQRDERLTAARQENECAASAVAALKTRVRAAEGQLEEAKLTAEAQDRARCEERERLEREKAALSCDIARKTAEAALLERQACQLRDELRRAGDNRGRCASSCPSSSPRPSGRCPSCPSSQRPSSHDRGTSVTADDSFVCRLKRLYRDLQDTAPGKDKI